MNGSFHRHRAWALRALRGHEWKRRAASHRELLKAFKRRSSEENRCEVRSGQSGRYDERRRFANEAKKFPSTSTRNALLGTICALTDIERIRRANPYPRIMLTFRGTCSCNGKARTVPWYITRSVFDIRFSSQGACGRSGGAVSGGCSE